MKFELTRMLQSSMLATKGTSPDITDERALLNIYCYWLKKKN